MTNKSNTKAGTRKKRRGLKFFLTLLILLGAAGTVFWFGLISINLEEGEYGVIFTKLTGYEEKAVRNGDFVWRWEALIPTNLTLHVFTLETRSVTLKTSGTLPSGHYYTSLSGENIDFNWDIETRIRYRLDSDTLPGLLADGLLESGLESIYSEYEAQITKKMKQIMEEQAGGDTEATPTERIRSVEKELSADLADLDDRMEILEISILNWNFPDMALYAEIRRMALDLMQQRQEVIAVVEDAALKRQDVQDAKITLLNRYGEVLDRYPILLDLFSLEGNPGASLLPEEAQEPAQ